MDFLLNDLSLDGQYPDIQTFQASLGRIMKMKELIRKFGRDCYCHRKIISTQVTSIMNFPQIINGFGRDQKRSIMTWLTKTGPFWEDERFHSPDDYMTCRNEIVTDSAVGEAAWCCISGIERHLISFSPSEWELSPVAVEFFENDEMTDRVDVLNFWEHGSVEKHLEKFPVILDSWDRVRETAIPRFTRLFFANDAFTPLEGHPFVHGAAQRLISLFKILEEFITCHDDQGKRTARGHEMYTDYFTGKKGDGGRGSLFKDSSDGEKSEFKDEMTFRHPEKPGESLFCPWHGSIQTPQYRIHFSWPVKAGEPMYIVYVGPKITKR